MEKMQVSSSIEQLTSVQGSAPEYAIFETKIEIKISEPPSACRLINKVCSQIF